MFFDKSIEIHNTNTNMKKYRNIWKRVGLTYQRTLLNYIREYKYPKISRCYCLCPNNYKLLNSSYKILKRKIVGTQQGHSSIQKTTSNTRIVFEG